MHALMRSSVIQHIKLEILSFTYPKDGPKFKKRSRDTDHAH